MAYTAPTADAFQIRFPAFAAVADATVVTALTQAARLTDATWIADDRAEAEMLYAAHLLTLDGLGTTREAQLTGFDRLKLGSLELQRSENAAQPGSLLSTSFGTRFKELMRRNVPAIKAV